MIFESIYSTDHIQINRFSEPRRENCDVLKVSDDRSVIFAANKHHRFPNEPRTKKEVRLNFDVVGSHGVTAELKITTNAALPSYDVSSSLELFSLWIH